MSSLSSAVQALEARRQAIEAELAQIDQRLRAISVAIGTRRPGRPAKALASTTVSTTKTVGKKLKNRSWFQPGEAVALMAKIAVKPIRPADMVRQLAAAKGYAGKLAKAQMDRFGWAALSAIKAALQSKHLTRAKDGGLVAAKK